MKSGMWVYCSIKICFCLFGLYIFCFLFLLSFVFVVFFFFLLFVFDFCNYLFFLFVQNAYIYSGKILDQVILATYIKHIGVPVSSYIKNDSFRRYSDLNFRCKFWHLAVAPLADCVWHLSFSFPSWL